MALQVEQERGSRFLDSDGLNPSKLLEKLTSLNVLWSKYWRQIYDTKYIPILKQEILDHPKYSMAWMEATAHYNKNKKKYGFQETFSK